MSEHFSGSCRLIAEEAAVGRVHRLASPRAQCFSSVLWSRSAVECALPKVAKRCLGPGRRRRAMPKKESAILLGMALPRVFASTSKRTRPEIT